MRVVIISMERVEGRSIVDAGFVLGRIGMNVWYHVVFVVFEEVLVV
jgi:hypothetical protein